MKIYLNKTATLWLNSNWLFPLLVVTINPSIVKFIRHLALTRHLTAMYKDSTNFGVNLTKGELYRTQNKYYEVVKQGNKFIEFVL